MVLILLAESFLRAVFFAFVVRHRDPSTALGTKRASSGRSKGAGIIHAAY